MALIGLLGMGGLGGLGYFVSMPTDVPDLPANFGQRVMDFPVVNPGASVVDTITRTVGQVAEKTLAPVIDQTGGTLPPVVDKTGRGIAGETAQPPPQLARATSSTHLADCSCECSVVPQKESLLGKFLTLLPFVGWGAMR